MYYLLFIFYFFILSYCITRVPFIRKTGLSPQVILLLFILKVLAGAALGWISLKYYPENDYWGANDNGFIEYKIMLNDPREFVTNIFRSPYANGYTGFFNSVGSYWNDLRYNIILKLLAFCNLASRGNYYINSLFFNFFGFFGPVALFRVFSDIYKTKKWHIITGCFLLPSTLYFSSGIHKDLIIFTLLGLFFYAIYFSVMQIFTFKRICIILLTFIFILLIRNYVAIALLPATIAFIFCMRSHRKPLFIFTGLYGSILLLVAALPFLSSSLQPLKIITEKQHDFFILPKAASQLQTNQLAPTIKSFAINLPQAIDHGFLRPCISEKKGIFLLPLALELLFYELLFLIVVFRYRVHLLNNSFIIASLTFATTMLLITGYIIPNIGSIVRYKSIYYPFLITPLLCCVTWNKRKY